MKKDFNGWTQAVKVANKPTVSKSLLLRCSKNSIIKFLFDSKVYNKFNKKKRLQTAETSAKSIFIIYMRTSNSIKFMNFIIVCGKIFMDGVKKCYNLFYAIGRICEVSHFWQIKIKNYMHHKNELYDTCVKMSNDNIAGQNSIALSTYTHTVIDVYF